MLPKRNTFCNSKSLSKDAPAWQQSASWRASHPPITGIRFRSFYSAPAPTSNFFLISGFLVKSARGAMTILQGGKL
jgi:hypothetical protein